MTFVKGEVLEVNIKRTITNCIVIAYEKERRFILGDKILKYQYEFTSLNKDTLKRENHDIYVFVKESLRIFYDCNQLLVGDKKMWICQRSSNETDYPTFMEMELKV